MSEVEYGPCADTEDVGRTDRLLSWLEALPWFGILTTIGVIIVVAGLGWLIWAHADDYRGQCHDAGGHIIEVRDAEICVDRENRVIFL